MATEAETATQACPNCKSILVGSYCYTCGQKDIGERLNTRVLLATAFEALTDMDSKLWRTMRELSYRPGQVALNYARGERARYINPIKYFITVFAVFMTLLIVSGGLDAEVAATVAVDPEKLPEELSLTLKVAVAFEAVLREYRNLLTFALLPLFAFFLRWQYFRAKHNYAETLSMVCFWFAQAHLFAIPLLLLQWTTGNFDQNSRQILEIVIFIFGAKIFYDMPWWKTLIACAISGFLYVIANMVSAGLFVGLRLAGVL